jgi:hypothetical protein
MGSDFNCFSGDRVGAITFARPLCLVAILLLVPGGTFP